jgi:Na+-driven multidrug efflux pump
MVARRVGENNNEAASKAGMQSIFISLSIAAAVSVLGLFAGFDKQ